MAWVLPLVTAGGVAAAVALSSGSASGASPDLPPRSAAQLITAVLNSDHIALSGTVQETANLGIPSLGGDHSSASLSWQTFIAGTHTARIWVGGSDKQRVALVGELSEADVIHNGSDLWTYTSDTNTVTHSTLPQSKEKNRGDAASSPADATPAAIAARALKAVNPSTKVSVDTTKMVAGRAAYTLVVQPRDPRSTVRKVTIAVDAAKSVPLQVSVYGSASSPAFRTGFTHVEFSTPPASTFAFHLPAGATVSKDPFGLTQTPGDHRTHEAEKSGGQSKVAHEAEAPGKSAVKVLGQDWTSVVEVHGAQKTLGAALGGTSLRNLTTPVGTAGARLLHTGLLNAVILPDGRAFIGAVQPSLLEHLAATTPN